MCGLISYTISKAGLESLTRYVAAEFAPIGIRVNAVSPCPVDTNSLRFKCINVNKYKDQFLHYFLN